MSLQVAPNPKNSTILQKEKVDLSKNLEKATWEKKKKIGLFEMCAWCVAAGTQTAPLADGARGAGGRVACRRPGSPSRCLCPAGVRVHGAAQRLHDPHAARAQLRHHQVPLQQAIPHLPQDAQGGVPAGHVAPLRLRGPQVSHGREQQLAPRSPAGTPAKSHSAFGAWSSN